MSPINFSKPFTPQKMSAAELRMTLIRVKHLYAVKEYRDCISECNLLLSKADQGKAQLHIIQITYLHYYLATSHELLAQPMQNLSPAKTVNLYDAKHHFELAKVKLEEMQPKSRLSPSPRQCGSQKSSIEELSSPESTTLLPQTPRLSLKGIPMKTSNTSPSLDAESFQQSVQVISVSPAEWLASGSPKKKNSAMNLTTPATAMPPPPTTPIKTSSPKTISEKTSSTKTSPKDFPTVDPSFKVFIPKVRCSRLATELAEIIDHNISWIDDAINDVAAAHQRRVDVSEIVEVDKKKDKDRQVKAYYAARRRDGWKRPRFDPGKTQGLCRMAMEEI